MPNFAIRLELNGPPGSKIYEDVHTVLSNAGYERMILSDKGAWWKLPDGMYVGTSNRTSACDEHDAIRPIVKSVWTDFELFVLQYTSSAWTGMTRLTPDS